MMHRVFTTNFRSIRWCICVFIVNVHSISTQRSSAVCFLTWQPTSDTIDFLHSFARNLSNVDVYLIIDDHRFSSKHIDASLIHIIQFDETPCNQRNYKNSNFLGIFKTCSAWDKALFFFSEKFVHHQFVWFIEEDVFIPSTDAFLAVHELYSHSNDLVVPEVNYIIDGSTNTWFHTPQMTNTMVLPWSYGMVCAMGASRKLLSAVDQFVQWRGHLVFIEFLYHTIVLHNPHMKVVTPIELSTVVFRAYYSLLVVQEAPNNWWHPVKNISLQRQWRASLMNRRPIDYDAFLQNLQSVEKRIDQSHTSKSFYDLVHDLDTLIMQFRSIQAQLAPSIRHQFRKRFLHLSINRSDPMKSKLNTLANMAFKLSEDRTGIYSSDAKERWARLKYLTIFMEMLELLAVNKRTVIESMKKETRNVDEMVTIDWLRDESCRLIQEINQQMTCEMSMIKCNRTRPWFEQHIPIHRLRSSSSSEYFGMLVLVLVGVFKLLCVSLNKRRITQRR